MREFIYREHHPKCDLPCDLEQRIFFVGNIGVFHSAKVTLYSPSNECGSHGMHHQYIRSNPSWYGPGQGRYDTAFVVVDEDKPGMAGMLIAHILLLFSFYDEYLDETIPCALINWVEHVDDCPDKITGYWVVKPKKIHGQRPIPVICLDAIARGAHLPVYGVNYLDENFSFIDALDTFKTYYICKLTY